MQKFSGLTGINAGVGSTLALASLGCHAVDASPSNTAAEIVVTGHPSINSYTTTIQDTPQNVNVLPSQLLGEQAVNSVQDALKNVPGITLNAGEGGTHGDNINLRGVAARHDFFLDGLRDTGFYTRDSFNLERLEIYKGPASTRFGRGSTGGVVNQVSKSALASDYARGTATFGTNHELRGTADLNYAFNDTIGARLNLMDQKADVADRDFVRNRRWGVAPTVTFGMGKPLTLSLDYLHQEQNDIPDYGIPFAFGRPVPVPRDTYYGLPGDDRTRSKVDVGTALLKAQFTPDVWLTDAFRAGNYFFDSRETAAHYGAAPPTAGTPLATVLTFRDRPSAQGTVKTLMNDADFHVAIQLNGYNLANRYYFANS